MTSRRFRYADAIAWIANNDEPSEDRTEVVASQVSVLLIADCTGREPQEVARDVVRERQEKGWLS